MNVFRLSSAKTFSLRRHPEWPKGHEGSRAVQPSPRSAPVWRNPGPRVMVTSAPLSRGRSSRSFYRSDGLIGQVVFGGTLVLVCMQRRGFRARHQSNRRNPSHFSRSVMAALIELCVLHMSLARIRRRRQRLRRLLILMRGYRRLRRVSHRRRLRRMNDRAWCGVIPVRTDVLLAISREQHDRKHRTK